MTEPTIERAPRRRHVAQRSRIVAAGLGATGMLGIVTLFGLQNPADGSTPSAVATVPPAPPVAPPVQVVIHRIPASTVPGTPAVDPAAAAAAPQPVQLTARPVVRAVTPAAPSRSRSSSSSSPSAAPAPAPAPVATTSGSK
jgi:hypothetical protein